MGRYFPCMVILHRANSLKTVLVFLRSRATYYYKKKWPQVLQQDTIELVWQTKNEKFMKINTALMIRHTTT